MRAFRYNGVDFSRWMKATPTKKLGQDISVETSEVPGRPGAVVLGSQVGAKAIPFLCQLREPWAPWRQMEEVRRRIELALYAPDGAELVSPEAPDLAYKDVYLTSPGELENLWKTGRAELEFTAYDPMPYGRHRSVIDATDEFKVGGTYQTWPVVTVRPAAGDHVRVTHAQSSDFIQLERDFDGTEEVVVDCGRQLVTVDGDSAMRFLTVTSDFFAFEPGANSVRVDLGDASAEWQERWVR